MIFKRTRTAGKLILTGMDDHLTHWSDNQKVKSHYRSARLADELIVKAQGYQDDALAASQAAKTIRDANPLLVEELAAIFKPAK